MENQKIEEGKEQIKNRLRERLLSQAKEHAAMDSNDEQRNKEEKNTKENAENQTITISETLFYDGVHMFRSIGRIRFQPKEKTALQEEDNFSTNIEPIPEQTVLSTERENNMPRSSNAVGHTKRNVHNDEVGIPKKLEVSKDQKPPQVLTKASNANALSVKQLPSKQISAKPFENKGMQGTQTKPVKNTVPFTKKLHIHRFAKQQITAQQTKAGTANVMKLAVKSVQKSASSISAFIFGGSISLGMVIMLLVMTGAIIASSFGIFFSGEDSGERTLRDVVRELNTEWMNQVQAIRREAEYEEITVNGSRATWPEVLSVFAAYVAEDPDSPVEVATMDTTKECILTEMFWEMNNLSHEVEVVTEMKWKHIEGEDGKLHKEQVEETKQNLTITISAKTPEEMAELYHLNQKQRDSMKELLSEKNRSLWSLALYGLHSGDGDMVAVALSQVGNVGGEPYWSWYGYPFHVEWCCIFVSWVANECGLIEQGAIPKFENCGWGADWFKAQGRWAESDYIPNPGDIIFFSWDGTGNEDHVGIVEKVENGFIYTIEGNWGDSCVQRKVPMDWYEILGYGLITAIIE